jgi:hypothetical protein
MESYSINIEKILIQQLEKEGIESSMIPRLIKDLTNSFVDNSSVSLLEVNDNLYTLGWNDIKIDYRAYELAKAYSEKNSDSIRPYFDRRSSKERRNGSDRRSGIDRRDIKRLNFGNDRRNGNERRSGHDRRGLMFL